MNPGPTSPPPNLLARPASTRARGELLQTLRDQPKRELYRRARELGLPGRSTMNKAQLVLALAAHERKQRLTAMVVARGRGRDDAGAA